MNKWISMTAALCLAVTLGCGSPRSGSKPDDVRDATYHRVNMSARSAFERGDLSRADELFEQALERARAMDRPVDIGNSAYHLGLCRGAFGHYDQATALFAEALAELKRAEEPVIDVLLADAEVAFLSGDRSRSWNSSETALQALEGTRDRPRRAQLYTLRVLLALADEDVEQGQKQLALAEEQARRVSSHQINARLAEVQGRLALTEGDAARAAAAFEQEADQYRTGGRFPDMARALSRAGLAHGQAEAYRKAADAHYRAARSLYSLGSPAHALRAIERALAALEREEDEALAVRVANLFEEISEMMKQNDE